MQGPPHCQSRGRLHWHQGRITRPKNGPGVHVPLYRWKTPRPGEAMQNWKVKKIRTKWFRCHTQLDAACLACGDDPYEQPDNKMIATLILCIIF